jgi:hypothetical protein
MSGGQIIALQSFDDSSNGGSSDSIRLVRISRNGEVQADYTEQARAVCGEIAGSAELQTFEDGVVVQGICGEDSMAWLSPDFDISSDMTGLGTYKVTFKASTVNCGALNVVGHDGRSIDVLDAEWVDISSDILAGECIEGSLAVNYPSIVSGTGFYVSLKFNPNGSGSFLTETCYIDLAAEQAECEVLETIQSNSISNFSESGDALVILPHVIEGESDLYKVDISGLVQEYSPGECMRTFGMIGPESVLAVTCDEELVEIPLSEG